MENIPNSPAPNPQNQIKYTDKLPEQLAYTELNTKNNKPPRKFPVLKIIIYFLVIIISIIIITFFYGLIKKQKVSISFKTPEAIISETPVSPVPKPTSNPCGYEAKLCPNGELSEKVVPECKFKTCDEETFDMNRFWRVSTNEKIRTYENIDLGYSFQAPVDWRFVGRDVGLNLFSHDYKCKKVDTDCTGANVLLLSSLTTGKINAKDFLASKENYVFPNAKKNINNLKTLNIGGLEAVLVKDGGTSETYVIVYNDTVFILSYGASNATKAAEAKKVFDTIISTIKFI